MWYRVQGANRGIVNPTTRILLEQIGLLGYRVAIAKDHVEALNLETGERFIVRGEDIDGMADELAGMVRVALEEQE